MTDKVDFTTWRKGTRTRGKSTIQYCPKCGRKGEYSRLTFKTGAVFDEYIHSGHIVMGMFFHVDERCSILVKKADPK